MQTPNPFLHCVLAPKILAARPLPFSQIKTLGCLTRLKRKDVQILILRVYQQTAHTDYSTLKLKGDKPHPQAQFSIGFLDPYLRNQGWLSLSEEKMAQTWKTQLKKFETIQREEIIVKIINIAREMREDKSNPEASAACFIKETWKKLESFG